MSKCSSDLNLPHEARFWWLLVSDLTPWLGLQANIWAESDSFEMLMNAFYWWTTVWSRRDASTHPAPSSASERSPAGRDMLSILRRSSVSVIKTTRVPCFFIIKPFHDAVWSRSTNAVPRRGMKLELLNGWRKIFVSEHEKFCEIWDQKQKRANVGKLRQRKRAREKRKRDRDREKRRDRQRESGRKVLWRKVGRKESFKCFVMCIEKRERERDRVKKWES